MNEDDMIVPEVDAPATNDEQPAAPAEIEGVLLDNDEVQDDATDENRPSDGAADGTGAPEDGSAPKEGASATDASTEVREEPAQLGTDTRDKQPVDQPTAQLTDPGEFQPKDYSFDVTLADGTVINIAKPEDINKLPEDADFGTPKNLMEAQAKYSRLLNGVEADKRDWEAKKEEFDKQQASTAELNAQVETMIKEMAYLETKGKLPKLAPEHEEADWNDPEVAKQPGVKERLALLEYRSKENEQRKALGLSPMSVLEAATEMANDAQVKQDAEVKQRQGQQRKDKGAMITGPTNSPESNVPDDMIVGDGGSIRDIGL